VDASLHQHLFSASFLLSPHRACTRCQQPATMSAPTKKEPGLPASSTTTPSAPSSALSSAPSSAPGFGPGIGRGRPSTAAAGTGASRGYVATPNGGLPHSYTPATYASSMPLSSVPGFGPGFGRGRPYTAAAPGTWASGAHVAAPNGGLPAYFTPAPSVSSMPPLSAPGFGVHARLSTAATDIRTLKAQIATLTGGTALPASYTPAPSASSMPPPSTSVVGVGARPSTAAADIRALKAQIDTLEATLNGGTVLPASYTPAPSASSMPPPSTPVVGVGARPSTAAAGTRAPKTHVATSNRGTALPASYTPALSASSMPAPSTAAGKWSARAPMAATNDFFFGSSNATQELTRPSEPPRPVVPSTTPSSLQAPQSASNIQFGSLNSPQSSLSTARFGGDNAVKKESADAARPTFTPSISTPAKRNAPANPFLNETPQKIRKTDIKTEGGRFAIE
jgi:hypothetical protein